MSQLAADIYLEMIAKTYTDLAKVEEEDLKQLAESAIKAAKVFESVEKKAGRGQQAL
jgi:hypothetical protein